MHASMPSMARLGAEVTKKSIRRRMPDSGCCTLAVSTPRVFSSELSNMVSFVAAGFNAARFGLIATDFNFPEIDWDLHYSTNKSFGSTVFFEYSS